MCGEKSSIHRRVPADEDHPRVCGEKALAASHKYYATGSPPRVRGKVTSTNPVENKVRITPACAGKRRSKSDFSYRRRDHPRVCGEKCRSCLVARHQLGSPPRVRGKAQSFAMLADAKGITPACAGKRPYPIICSSTVVYHPRVCGEKAGPGADCVWQAGSPPRVRGKADLRLRSRAPARITPACAGKR